MVTVHLLVRHNHRTLSFQWRNLVNMQFFYTKKVFQARPSTELHEVLPKLFTASTAFHVYRK